MDRHSLCCAAKSIVMLALSLVLAYDLSLALCPFEGLPWLDCYAVPCSSLGCARQWVRPARSIRRARRFPMSQLRPAPVNFVRSRPANWYGCSSLTALVPLDMLIQGYAPFDGEFSGAKRYCAMRCSSDETCKHVPNALEARCNTDRGYCIPSRCDEARSRSSRLGVGV